MALDALESEASPAATVTVTRRQAQAAVFGMVCAGISTFCGLAAFVYTSFWQPASASQQGQEKRVATLEKNLEAHVRLPSHAGTDRKLQAVYDLTLRIDERQRAQVETIRQLQEDVRAMRFAPAAPDNSPRR